MKSITVKEAEIKIRRVDGLEGYYLCRQSDWSKEVASQLAAQDNLKLNEIHWCVLKEFRQYYNEFQCFPSEKVLKDKILYNCKISYVDFSRLFPKEHHQAARISGICLPTGYGYTL